MRSLILGMALVFGASFAANAQVLGEEEMAELVVTGISGPKQIVEGVPFTVTATIKNEGNIGTGTFRVQHATGHWTGSFTTVSNLLPGQSITVSRTYTLPENSNRTAIAFSWFADIDYSVPEENDFLNNYASTTIDVK